MRDSPPPDPRVDLIEKTTAYAGYFKVEAYRLRHVRYAGGWTDEMARELFERGDAAVVLPYDPARDTVVLIEQFRIGAFAAGCDPWLVEPVAGIVEPGETPEDVARREAREEAGCEIRELEPIGTVLPSPGGCSETLFLFCGRTDSTDIGGVHGLDHEHEDIKAFALPFADAMTRLTQGGALNASTVITLQWLAGNREWLRKTWL